MPAAFASAFLFAFAHCQKGQVCAAPGSRGRMPGGYPENGEAITVSDSATTEQQRPVRQGAKAPPRPVFFDLFRIQFPVGSIASFLHRVTGVLLLLALPFLVLLFERSLASPEHFATLAATLGSPLARLLLIVLAWALAHHIFARLRHLAMDAGVGWRLASARRSAALVIAAGVLVAVVFGGFAL